MTLLGFDTSTAASTACVLRADGEAFEVAPGADRLAGPPAHAAELMPAIAGAMRRAGVSWDDLDGIAAGVGPGSFTGLRIGVATARALAAARGLQVRPVSSLAALAAGIDGELRLALIDAKRGELFAALHGPEGELWAPFAAPPAAIAERVRDAGLSPLAAGDGSVRFRELLEQAGVRVAPNGSDAHVVRALHVCRLAAGVEGEPAEALLPQYLRAPDAAPQ